MLQIFPGVGIDRRAPESARETSARRTSLGLWNGPALLAYRGTLSRMRYWCAARSRRAAPSESLISGDVSRASAPEARLTSARIAPSANAARARVVSAISSADVSGEHASPTTTPEARPKGRRPPSHRAHCEPAARTASSRNRQLDQDTAIICRRCSRQASGGDASRPAWTRTRHPPSGSTDVVAETRARAGERRPRRCHAMSR